MLLILFFGLLLALLFAGAESALLALSARRHERGQARLPERLEELLVEPEPLLHSLGLGNQAAIGLAAMGLVTILVPQCGGPAGALLAALILAPLAAIATEAMPSLLSRRHPGPFLAAVELPLTAFARLLRPIARVSLRTTQSAVMGFERLLRLEPVAGAARSSVRADAGEDDKLFASIAEFSSTLVKEVMVPRRDMVALPADADLARAIECVRETEYSRIPVYRGRPENVVGVLHAKDLLPYARGIALDAFSLAALARRPLYVPGVMTLDDILAEFQIRGTHMAFVVDEFGSTAGLVTLEDVLEEIFGEIQDEHDPEEFPIRRAGRSAWLVDGKTPLEEVEEVLAVKLPETGCETLGGFVFHCLGHLPEPGENFMSEGLTLEVVRVEKHRVREVRVSTAMLSKERARVQAP